MPIGPTPQPAQQLLRYAGVCAPLKEYLVERNVWSRSDNAHWEAIVDWCKTDDGVEWLVAAGLDPSRTVPQVIQGRGHGCLLQHAYNCCFVPDHVPTDTEHVPESQWCAFVGSLGVKQSSDAMQWVISQVDMSGFLDRPEPEPDDELERERTTEREMQDEEDEEDEELEPEGVPARPSFASAAARERAPESDASASEPEAVAAGARAALREASDTLDDVKAAMPEVVFLRLSNALKRGHDAAFGERAE